jgi:hypothetical protein
MDVGKMVLSMIGVAREQEQAAALVALRGLDEWRAKYPGVRLYHTVIDGVLFVARPATEQGWAQFDEASRSNAAAAQMGFVHACLLAPAREVLAEMIEARPLLRLKLVEQCLRVSGFDPDYDFRRS